MKKLTLMRDCLNFAEGWSLLKRAGKDSSNNQIKLDSSIEQTTKTNYLGHLNWQEALKLNLALGGETLILRQSDDLALDLIDAIEGNKKIRKETKYP